MVKTGKFLENAIDLHNMINRHIHVNMLKNTMCDSRCIASKHGYCIFFDRECKNYMTRHEDCIRIFGEKSNG